MKLFALIIAILIWLLTAFGCEPAKPTSLPTETPMVTPAPTKNPAGPTAAPTAAPVEGNSEREDTLLPEI